MSDEESDAAPIRRDGDQRQEPLAVETHPNPTHKNIRVLFCAGAILMIALFVLVVMVAAEWSQIPKDIRQIPPYPTSDGVFVLHASNGEGYWALTAGSH